MNKYIHIFKNITYGIGGMLLLVSCNKDFPNLLQNFNEAKDSPENRDKVLMVIVDGLAGPAVHAIEPTNLIEMTRNGMVSYGSLADPTTDFQMTNASVASSLLTGVYANKNKVVSNDLSTLDAATYPTMFSRLKSTNKASSMYTSSVDYTTFLGKDAHVETVANDEAVVAAAVKGLEADTADLNVVHLTDVEQAGAISEYSDESTVYVDAVNKLDKQVLQLANTIKARKSYGNENWLVVITSGKGGDSKDPVTDFTAFGDSKRNTYTLMYSPKFSRKILPRPSTRDIPFFGSATRLTYAANARVTSSLSDENKFNMGTESDWTITLFLKYNVAGAGYYWPSFLSKRASNFGGTAKAGWNMFLEGGYWGINHSLSSTQAFGPNINDGKWHALTTVIKRSGSYDSLYVYTDGTNATVPGQVSRVAANGNNLDNNTPLTLGYLGGDAGNLDVSICNLQIYNRAFTFDEVKQYAGVTLIDEKFPFWSNLQGYWPGYDDANTSTLTEKTGRGVGNFNLKGATSWTSFNELVPFFQPPINDSFFLEVPNAVDVPFMIYQWLGVSVETAWKLDGKSWSPNYAQIRN